MNAALLALAVAVVLLALLAFYRTLAGPTVYDRMVGVGVISTKTLVLLLIIGCLYGRLTMFVDIAVGYALLNFIGTIAVARYLEDQGA